MPRRSIIQGFTAPDHDHALCVDEALDRADAVCAGQGGRLTPLRREVLELVWRSHRPVKAYDLLDTIAERRKRAAPPTVYRALEFLQDVGLIHRIESLNAFIGCAEPDRAHFAQFLICETCGAAAELDDPALHAAIDRNAARLGFRVSGETVEIVGVCRTCRQP